MRKVARGIGDVAQVYKDADKEKFVGDLGNLLVPKLKGSPMFKNIQRRYNTWYNNVGNDTKSMANAVKYPFNYGRQLGQKLFNPTVPAGVRISERMAEAPSDRDVSNARVLWAMRRYINGLNIPQSK
jgi:hypothetical protein